MSYLDELNDRQREAVEITEGPLLIVAGAGAGKTKTLTHRILHLIKKGVAPEQILAITFTNKAAKEMSDRVHALLSSDSSLNLPVSSFPSTNYSLPTTNSPWVSTFHSLGVHILRANAEKVGIKKRFAILDKSESLKLVRDAMEKVGISKETVEPRKIQSVISREKGSMRTRERYEAEEGTSYFGGMVTSVWNTYERLLTEENALDFDDLLLKTALLLKKDEGVRRGYQNRFRYLHIDEYQDTNKVQYEIARCLTGEQKNICVVGDSDQCLLPDTKIKTADGEKKIKDIKEKTVVVGASGNGAICNAKVSKVKVKVYDGEIVEIKTESGKKITVTPEHILFARLTLTENTFYVYLMYRRDKGFRIGMAKSVRQGGTGRKEIGLLVRCNQEKADKMWVLKMCRTKSEAAYFEIYFSSHYGIPMLVFFTSGRKMSITQNDIDTLFKKIDTRKRAEKLFQETGLNFSYPHYFPQGTTQSNTERDRLNINLNMFGDRRKSLVHPWGMSRVSINTTEIDLKKKLEQGGFSTRKGKKNDWRLEITRLDYGETEQIAETIQNLKPNLTLIRSAFITEGKKMLFQPASNIFPGMALGVMNGEKITEEKVISVERKRYKGKVYDLNIDKIHNYIANNVVVHNCIYGWRGANIRNILDFEKDFPAAQVVLLEENYRSTKTILAAANRIIQKNTERKDKRLFTQNAEGEKIGVFEAYDETDEARFVATKSAELIAGSVRPDEIAVLYRANFQSRALEEAMLRAGVPYQVLGTRFFERKEVKDVVAYLRAAENPESSSDLKRIINTPARGIGKVTLLKILAGKENELPAKMREKITGLRSLLEKICESASHRKLSDTIRFIISASGLEHELKEGGEEGQERLENIRELVTFATKYDHLPPEEAREKFETDAALGSEQDELLQEKGGVKLMTVHAAKGLEFSCVFVTGLEEGLFPHSRAGERETEGKDEEERRLFYVALTRAKKKVFLSYASVRTIFGSKQVNAPSAFLLEVDDGTLEQEGQTSSDRTVYLD